MFPFLNKEKPVKIRFLFDQEMNNKRVTVYDSITLERLANGERSTERLVILMSHFMVDENNQPIPEEKAMRTLERLNGEDFAKVSQDFVNGIQQAAIPKANGSGLSSPSEVGQAVTTLPAGPQL